MEGPSEELTAGWFLLQRSDNTTSSPVLVSRESSPPWRTSPWSSPSPDAAQTRSLLPSRSVGSDVSSLSTDFDTMVGNMEPVLAMKENGAGSPLSVEDTTPIGANAVDAECEVAGAHCNAEKGLVACGSPAPPANDLDSFSASPVSFRRIFGLSTCRPFEPPVIRDIALFWHKVLLRMSQAATGTLCPLSWVRRHSDRPLIQEDHDCPLPAPGTTPPTKAVVSAMSRAASSVRRGTAALTSWAPGWPAWQKGDEKAVAQHPHRHTRHSFLSFNVLSDANVALW